MHRKKNSPYAQRLKYVRRRLADQRGVGKISQATFAKIVEVHVSAISHVEAGNTRHPTRLGQGDRGKDRISPGLAFNR